MLVSGDIYDIFYDLKDKIFFLLVECPRILLQKMHMHPPIFSAYFNQQNKVEKKYICRHMFAPFCFLYSFSNNSLLKLGNKDINIILLQTRAHACTLATEGLLDASKKLQSIPCLCNLL